MTFLRGEDLTEHGSLYIPRPPLEDPLETSFSFTAPSFRQPNMRDTLDGIKRIAEAKALDVISLGSIQDAQENSFTGKAESAQHGCGGVLFAVSTIPKVILCLFAAGTSRS